MWLASHLCEIAKLAISSPSTRLSLGEPRAPVTYTGRPFVRGYLLIQRALHVPTCPTNLLSVAQLTDYGHTVALGKDRPRIELSNDGGTANLDRTNRLWAFAPSAAVAQ